MQDDLTERLNRLVDGDPANVFDHCDRMLDQLDDVFERGKTDDEQRTAQPVRPVDAVGLAA